MASFVVYGDASGQVTVKAPAVAGSNTITFPAETGTLITSASTSMPNTIAWNTTVQTTGFTAVANAGYFCNTTSAAFTVTLPATPTRGQFVVIVDYAGTAATNNITVSGNGANINGGSGSFVLSTNRTGVTVTYIDSTQGWVASSNVYGAKPGLTYSASYLLVAGGAGGGGTVGGGGGAGGYLSGTLTLTQGTVYTASVGGGGSGGPARSNGNPTTFTGLTTAVGGGIGGTYPNGAGSSGGSGGGASGGPAAAGSGTPGQGNPGGAGSLNPAGPNYAAGGGGSGGAGTGPTGAQPTSAGSPGGVGTASSITGTPITYAGGGGGGGGPGTSPTNGGPGGGGPGGINTGNGTAGTANLGGGGGGGGNPGGTGGAGGSGVVIISVPTTYYSGTYTGTATVTTSGSNTIIKWTTGSGTYTA